MPRYYEHKVALQELQPRIWRRLLLRTTASFAQLYHAIQDSFGWKECHLWEFRLPLHQGRPITGLPGGEELDRLTHDEDPDELGAWLEGWWPNGFDLARAFDR